MSDRTFLIQRYASGNWPQIKGHVPFIASGPGFMAWVDPGSLDRRGCHALRPGIRNMLRSSFPAGSHHQHMYQAQAAAEVLLGEGVLSALWSIDSNECLPPELRWEVSVREVVGCISCLAPDLRHVPLHESIAECISGMASPAMHRAYLSEDGLGLEPVAIP